MPALDCFLICLRDSVWSHRSEFCINNDAFCIENDDFCDTAAQHTDDGSDRSEDVDNMNAGVFSSAKRRGFERKRSIFC